MRCAAVGGVVRYKVIHIDLFGLHRGGGELPVFAGQAAPTPIIKSSGGSISSHRSLGWEEVRDM